MSKTDIDYSNTVFYKIHCKDDAIKDVYVGHTTDFNKRKRQHKRSCVSGENKKVYRFIRENGGWNNWEMIIIGYNRCENLYDARRIEQEYFESLDATLNSVEPLAKASKKVIKEKKIKHEKTESKFYCDKCDYRTGYKKDFHKHLATRKHKIRIGEIEKSAYRCDCGKVYKHASSLWNHKQRCDVNNDSDKIDQNVIMELIQQNKILQEKLLKFIERKHVM